MADIEVTPAIATRRDHASGLLEQKSGMEDRVMR